MSGDNTINTLTAQEERAGPEPTPADYLFLLLECARPAALGARFRLDQIDELVIGRGHALRAEAGAGRRTLAIRVADRLMSSSHARLRRLLGGWALTDLDSKNGMMVNGARATEVRLADGDLIEIGHTLFRFRSGLPAVGEPAVIPDAPPALAGVASLVPALEERLEALRKVAASPAPIVLVGETGAGKELLARAVHAWSGRSGPLVAVNCGALNPNLCDSALFGHRRGAFSGATESRPGLVRAADGGTLFLDEIADLPPAGQAALLRVLQEREVLPVGETEPVAVDLRWLSATQRDLDALAASGRLRPDLLARLGGFRFVLPPLRQRVDDLGLLVGTLLRRLAGDAAGAVTLAPETARALVRHPWPGNARELERVLESALALAAGGAILPAHLPPELGAERPARLPVPAGADELEARLVALLREHRGNLSAVARALGKARTQVQRWVKRFNLRPEDFAG
jgi:transcriptional regulator of acetoin/glycerol metabolism